MISFAFVSVYCFCVWCCVCVSVLCLVTVFASFSFPLLLLLLPVFGSVLRAIRASPSCSVFPLSFRLLFRFYHSTSSSYCCLRYDFCCSFDCAVSDCDLWSDWFVCDDVDPADSDSDTDDDNDDNGDDPSTNDSIRVGTVLLAAITCS